MSIEEKSGEEVEAPAPEKSVLDLISEGEAAEGSDEASVEGDEPVGEEPVEDSEGPPPEPEEKSAKQVPVSAVQRERQRRRDAEARARELEDRLAAIEAKVQAPPSPQQQLQKPKFDQFDSIEEYNDAMAEYTEKRAEVIAEEKALKVLQSQTEEGKARAARERAAQEQQAFINQMDKARDKWKDFDDSFDFVNSVSQNHPGYARAIVTSDVAGEVINYLAKNPDEADRIASLSHEGQMKAIGAIEDKIKAPPPKPKNTTKAPAPVNAVSGAAKTSGTVKWKPGMTDAERARWTKEAAESGVSVAELLE